jgi:two-component system NtrC family sensor kinase
MTTTDGAAAPRLRVLAIDDEDGILRAVKRVLAAHDLVTCTDGASGLAALEQGAFDVILCDFNMPGGFGGPEVYAAIAARWPELARRVVFLSGGQHAGARVELPVRWVDKPFSPADLRQVVVAVATAP